MQYCENCQRQLPIEKYPLHLGYCRRNIIKCQICQRPYDKNLEQEHTDQFHQTKQCQYCNQILPLQDHANHMQNCTNKPIMCEHCSLNIPRSIFPEHLKQCQSRSQLCEQCHQHVQIKDYYMHLSTCQPIPQKQQQNEYEPLKYYQPITNYQPTTIRYQQPIRTTTTTTVRYLSPNTGNIKYQPTTTTTVRYEPAATTNLRYQPGTTTTVQYLPAATTKKYQPAATMTKYQPTNNVKYEYVKYQPSVTNAREPTTFNYELPNDPGARSLPVRTIRYQPKITTVAYQPKGNAPVRHAATQIIRDNGKINDCQPTNNYSRVISSSSVPQYYTSGYNSNSYGVSNYMNDGFDDPELQAALMASMGMVDENSKELYEQIQRQHTIEKQLKKN